MPRTYKAKGVHTNPEDAGQKNLEPILDTLPKDESGLNAKIMPIYKHKEPYHGRWTPEQLQDSIVEFFDYCTEVDLKPTQPGLRLWLKVSRDTLWDWKTNKDGKYGDKCDIIKSALDFMELYLQGNIDKYPTGSIFLLKSSFGHAETSNVNIVSSTPTSDEVADQISKLGLDK